MRKSILAVCTLLMVAFMISCDKGPSLVGKWKAEKNQEEVKDGEAQKVSMVFAMDLLKDSSMVVDVKAVMDGSSKEMTMHLPMATGFMGKWSADETTLKWIPTDSTKYFSLDKDSLKITFKDPTMEALSDKIIKSTLEGMEKEQGKDVFGDMVKDNTWSYKLEGDKLTLIAEKDTLVFTREK